MARGLKETRDKYVDREGLRDQLTRLKKAWPELRERIRRQIIPFDEVRRRLELVGAPYEPEQIGVSRTRFREAFGKIPYMRSRYTVIDTAFRCGWMEEWLDRPRLRSRAHRAVCGFRAIKRKNHENNLEYRSESCIFGF